MQDRSDDVVSLSGSDSDYDMTDFLTQQAPKDMFEISTETNKTSMQKSATFDVKGKGKAVDTFTDDELNDVSFEDAYNGETVTQVSSGRASHFIRPIF